MADITYQFLKWIYAEQKCINNIKVSPKPHIVIFESTDAFLCDRLPRWSWSFSLCSTVFLLEIILQFFKTPNISVLIGLSKEECILPSTYGSFSGKPAQSISKSFRIKDEIMEIFDHFLQMTVSGTLPNVHKSKVLAAAKPDLTNAACRWWLPQPLLSPLGQRRLQLQPQPQRHQGEHHLIAHQQRHH